MRLLLGPAVLFACCLLQMAAGQSDTANAAVKYLRADVALRQAYPLAPDAASNLEKTLESPQDSDDEKLVAAAGEPLIEMQHGAALNTCLWEVSSEDGPLANAPIVVRSGNWRPSAESAPASVCATETCRSNGRFACGHDRQPSLVPRRQPRLGRDFLQD